MPAYVVETPQRTYSCVVERGVLQRAAQYLPPKSGRVFLVTTRDVWALYENAVRHSLPDAEVLFFPGGEVNKRLASLEALSEQMAEAGADRTSVVVGLGGGIVTDLAGFLAATFMRGIPVLQIPTTLLAQVDAALGGKTGVNLSRGKNLVGSFHQPHAVLVDPEVLRSLPLREYRAGLYEVIKHGVIRDASLFDVMDRQREQVLALDMDILEQRVLGDSIRIKAEVVSQDEREGDLRRILNFGHTFGHALEAATSYARLLHGEAVAYGMRAASHLAQRLGLLSEADASRIITVVRSYGSIPDIRDVDPDELVTLMRGDKKTLHGSLHFVLPTRIGEVKVVKDPDPSLVREATAIALAG